MLKVPLSENKNQDQFIVEWIISATQEKLQDQGMIEEWGEVIQTSLGMIILSLKATQINFHSCV